MTALLSAAGIIVLISLSAFFSAAEMSYSSCSNVRMENLAEKGDRKALKVLSILKRFDDALSAILIGNNLVNIASSSLASVLVILLTGNDRLTWAATAVMTVMVIIFGETVPKISAKKNANRLALRWSGVIEALTAVLRPVVILVTGIISLITGRMEPVEEQDEEEAVEEFQSIIETAEDEGVIDEDSSELMQAAIDFPEMTAQECMTSRVDMQAIDIGDGIGDILKFIEKTPYTRIPVYEGSKDSIIGVLHLNHLFRELTKHPEAASSVDIRKLLMPPIYVYRTMYLPLVLKRMRKAKQHLAIVTDEYAGTVGIITLEDVLEQIVGDIWDETDTVEEEVVNIGENQYIIDADMPIGEFLELFEKDEDEFDYESETVGGFCIEFLEDFPRKGDSFDFEDLHIEILSSDGLRVEKVAVKKEH